MDWLRVGNPLSYDETGQSMKHVPSVNVYCTGVVQLPRAVSPISIKQNTRVVYAHNRAHLDVPPWLCRPLAQVSTLETSDV